MKYIDVNERVPVSGSYDVIVAGGGVAGVAAALSARRAGKRVLLIEKGINLGGLATVGLVNFFVPMCNGRGKKIASGMCGEFVKLATAYGYDTLPDEWRAGEPAKETNVRYVTRFSHSIFALALTELVTGEGIDLRFDTVVSRPVMKENTCLGLVTESKSGREFFEAGVVIDATGDSDILFRAGVPTVQGGNYFTYYGFAVDMESCRRALETGDISKALYWQHGGRATLYGEHHPEGMRKYAGTTADDVTEYIVKNQLALLNVIKTKDRTKFDMAALPGMAQLRTTRRVEGDYTLTEADAYRRFEDSVCAICDFDRADIVYEVPLRCLARADYPNLITAGRSASARGYAWDVLRVIPPAVSTGQAAGAAAALALETDKAISSVDINALQKRLAGSGVMLHN